MGVKRAALVGCGDVSVIHFEAFDAIDGIELVAVADTDPERLAAAASARGVPGYPDHLTMLAEARPDVVHITTPHDEHIQISIDCLAAGVNVVQEKPLAHTLAEADRLVAAAQTAQAKVGICFQNRYNVSSQEARRILDSGELGQIHGAWSSVVWTRTADYYRARPWRGTWRNSGGGLLINQAIHTLDLIQWLMGDVVAVEGRTGTHKFADVIEVEDTAEALFTHAGGTTTSFYATLTAPDNRPVELEIVAENGTMTIRDGLTVVWRDGRVDTYPERAVPSGGRAYWGVSHEILIQDFYARLADPEPFWISPAEARKSLAMLKDVYRSSGLSPAGVPEPQ